MPELPEVETIVRDLRPCLVKRRITSIQIGPRSLRRPWLREWGPLLVGRRIQSVGRRGKWILVELEGARLLVVHLGMTGQLRVVPASDALAPHTHVVIGLSTRREQLRFRDVRRFGCLTLYQGKAAADDFIRSAGLGPEPFRLRPGYWAERLARTGRSLKAFLLDQREVAGVGNIYADEALFEARLHPGRTGRDLERMESARLGRAVARVLNRAITRRGSTIRDYVDGSGQEGRYQREFRVYGCFGKPCPRCRTPIARLRLAGRSTHFCPACQLATG